MARGGTRRAQVDTRVNDFPPASCLACMGLKPPHTRLKPSSISREAPPTKARTCTADAESARTPPTLRNPRAPPPPRTPPCRANTRHDESSFRAPNVVFDDATWPVLSVVSRYGTLPPCPPCSGSPFAPSWAFCARSWAFSASMAAAQSAPTRTNRPRQVLKTPRVTGAKQRSQRELAISAAPSSNVVPSPTHPADSPTAAPLLASPRDQPADGVTSACTGSASNAQPGHGPPPSPGAA